MLRQSVDEMAEVLVIGGGVTGSGVALDAQDRGLNTILVEKGQFGTGTSSRSTKLIHAGIRYLKQAQFGIVRKTGLERDVLSKIVPHLVKPIKLVIPVFSGDEMKKWQLKLGMKIFELLVKTQKDERSEWVNLKRLKQLLPKITTEDCLGAMTYHERMTIDSRLVIELVKRAYQKGVKALNYTEVVNIKKVSNHFEVIVKDHLSGETFLIKSKTVINASGPWVDNLRLQADQNDHKMLTLTKGIHLVFDQSHLYLNQAVYFSGPDGRMLFAIPRYDKVYIGTTDTFYYQDPDLISVSKEDAEYVIEAFNFRFGNSQLKLTDIESSWVGLRPLIGESEGKKPSEISRKDEVIVSDTGMYSIAGGKLTGYRIMAKEIVDKVMKDHFPHFKKSRTHQIRLVDKWKSKGSLEKLCVTYVDFDCRTIEKVVDLFGENAHFIFENANSKSGDEEWRVMEAIIDYVVNSEACVDLADLVRLHTDWLYFEIQKVIRFEKEITSYMSGLLKWSAEEIEKQKKRLKASIAEASCSKIK